MTEGQQPKLLPDSFVAPASEIRAAFAQASAAEVVFVARQCLETGAWDQALAVCEALADRDDPVIEICAAVANFVAGERAVALHRIERVLAHRPDHLSALAVQAQITMRLGQPDRAVTSLLRLIDRYPDYPGAQPQLATLLMPGPHYRQVLTEIHERLRPKTYLEIGFDTGATLSLARYSSCVVGVDPGSQEIKHPLPVGARLFREESDVFFAQHTRAEVLGSRQIDLTFVDGLHRFENVLSDFANAEAWSHPGACIVLHDCVPLVRGTATRERRTRFWVGDTWKIVPILRRFRPDLQITTLPCPPSGLVIVRALRPGSQPDWTRDRDAMLEAGATLEWTSEPGSIPAEFNAVTNDERGLMQALGL
ncbi:MAG TPA: class I SAM-dependent methyltransferase [Polyangiaceae bacterium]|nr:class I SAM-dependent methyltransferase [Polyangiaceae bacterium]